MQAEYKEAIEKGVIVWRNIFQTERGEYILTILKHKGQFYICKLKNRKITFVGNLGKMKPVEPKGEK